MLLARDVLICLLFSSVQLLSHVQLFATPWTIAYQASLSITNSWSPPKLMSIESVMPSNHLILCRPLLLPSIFPSIRVFSNESALHIRLTQSGTHFSLTSWEGYISIFIIFSKKFTKSQTWSYVTLDKWKLIIKEKLTKPCQAKLLLSLISYLEISEIFIYISLLFDLMIAIDAII